MTTTPANVASALLDWYDGHARDLPWRSKDPDPYGVLVSEFMLQQTQVVTVVPYWRRFMRRFPTPAALARASEDEVLKAWEGMGYYGRARRLHQAAREIQERYGGRVPDDLEALRRLPGVGDYTAAAVASIAFGQPVAAVDGNVMRVVARLYAVEEPIDCSVGKKRVKDLAARLLPASRPGDFNQAIMELGALICTPRRPQCHRCPLASTCAALSKGKVHSLPVRRRDGRGTPLVAVATAVLLDRPLPGADESKLGRVLVVRRPPGGLLAGMWGFPAVEGSHADSMAARRALGELLATSGLACRLMELPFGRWEHVFSHRRWRLEAFLGWPLGDADPHDWPRRLAERLGIPGEDALWVHEERWAELALPRPFQRVLEGLRRRVMADYGRLDFSLDLRQTSLPGFQQDPSPGME